MWEMASRNTPYENVHPDAVRACVRDGQREEFDEEWECPGRSYYAITSFDVSFRNSFVIENIAKQGY